MILRELLYGISILQVIGKVEVNISDIFFNSNIVTKDSIFVALKGSNSDGHKYIPDAIDNGAIVIICEEIPFDVQKNINYIKVEESHKALSILASRT